MLAPATIPTTPSRLGDDWRKEASKSLQAMIGENVVSSPSGTVIGESHLPRPGCGRGRAGWGSAVARGLTGLWVEVLSVLGASPAAAYP